MPAKKCKTCDGEGVIRLSNDPDSLGYHFKLPCRDCQVEQWKALNDKLIEQANEAFKDSIIGRLMSERPSKPPGPIPFKKPDGENKNKLYFAPLGTEPPGEGEEWGEEWTEIEFTSLVKLPSELLQDKDENIIANIPEAIGLNFNGWAIEVDPSEAENKRRLDAVRNESICPGCGLRAMGTTTRNDEGYLWKQCTNCDTGVLWHEDHV